MWTRALPLALIVAAAAPARAAMSPAPSLPPERFAPDVARLHAEGWRLAAIDLHENADGSGDEELSLTLEKNGKAERLTLSFEEWGEAAVDYRRLEVPAPAERRVYAGEAELMELLAAGPATKLYHECGSTYLQGPGGDVAIDPFAYHVVDKQARGAGAGRVLASELGGALGAGMKLVEVREEGATVELVLADGEQRVVRAERDKAGAIVAVEVRRSPVGYAWQTIHTPGVVKALVKGREVKSLRVESDETGGKVVGVLKNGKKFVIDLDDVEQEESYEGECGC